MCHIQYSEFVNCICSPVNIPTMLLWKEQFDSVTYSIIVCCKSLLFISARVMEHVTDKMLIRIVWHGMFIVCAFAVF